MTPLAAMIAYPRWINWRGLPDPDKPGKTKKIPLSPTTGRGCDPTNAQFHVDYPTAYARHVATGDGLAFVFVETDPFFFVDIDNCLINGAWSPLANDIMRRLSGCAIEVSQSGTGLHVFGRGHVPEHSCKNIPLGLELYTDKRFCAITFASPVGDAATDASAAISQLAHDYFPPNANDSDVAGWTSEPRPGWDNTLADDAYLIERATKTGENTNAAARFGYMDGKARFGDLWTDNTEALALAYPGSSRGGYDASSADAALAAHLCWWTGHDMERVERLMRSSRLARDKWDDRPEYLATTIFGASGAVGEKFAKPRAANVGSTAGEAIGSTFGVGQDKVSAAIRLLSRNRVTARYNRRAREFDICIPPEITWAERPPGCLRMDDATLRQLCNWISSHLKISLDQMAQALFTMGDLDSFDPVCDYLGALVWDGQPRIDALLVHYCNADDTALNRAIGRHFLLGAIARAFHPGCAHDEVLALTGAQGCGKSTFTKILGGEWHCDQPILGMDAREIVERVGSGWLVELPEVRLTGRDGNAIKAFLSATVYRARAAYGRVTDTMPVGWTYVATGNEFAFLTDATGNRRWHPVSVGQIRLDELARDRDQIWAEAVSAFPNWHGVAREKRRIDFPPDLWLQLAELTDSARLIDPWEETLAGMADALLQGKVPHVAPGFVSGAELLIKLGAMRGMIEQKRLATVCQRLGWQPHRCKIGNNYSRGYLIERPGVTANDQLALP